MDGHGFLLGSREMSVFARALDQWFGRGEFSITTPPMDGAFRPNDALDAAASVLETPVPDNLAVTSQGLMASSGPSLLSVEKPAAPAAVFDADITALAGLPDGGAVVALADGRIKFLGGVHNDKTIAAHPEIRCITALAAGADGALLVANGSSAYGPSDWKRDLMATNPSGSVWRLDPANGAFTHLVGALAYPYGLLEANGGVLISESWRSAVTRLDAGARRPEPVLDNLPAYPSRLSRSPDGAIWLALFAPRSQLVEFVLREPAYRGRMTSQIDPEHWVAPSLRSGRSPLEPTQQGGVKQLGVLKAWSPTRSYGLVARLDAAGQPLRSWHSRANGTRHGVTSCLARNGQVYFAAKGDGVIASFADPGVSP
jgi:hypothetical protein